MIARVSTSPKRWLGDETGATWEPCDRMIMVGLGWYEEGLCSGCGDLLSVTTDPTWGWKVDDVECIKCASFAIIAERRAPIDEANKGVEGAPIPEARRSWAEQIPYKGPVAERFEVVRDG